MRNSLLVKIMAAFLGLIIISALVFSISTYAGTRKAFNQYSFTNRREWSYRLAESLADFYMENGNWQGVENILVELIQAESRTTGSLMGRRMNDHMGKNPVSQMSGMMDGYNLHILFADSTRTAIYDNQAKNLGNKIPQDEYESGIPVMVNNQQVGSLLVTSGSIVEGSPAANFLDSVNHSIVFSVITGGLIAILMGALFFNQIISPLRQLKKAAIEVGNGNFQQRVNIRSNDEFADVGSSFNQMAHSLEKAEESRQHYLADVAHELRTPLTTIQGTVEAMQDKILPLDEEQLEILHNQTDLLNRLVNDLRLLSMAETGQLKLELSRVNPGSLTTRIIDSIKPLAAQKSIRLDLNIQSNLPDCELDSDRYTQILNNLISNAIRYTPENGNIQVNISTDDDANQLDVKVTDSGSGISVDDLPFVFDRFYRADKSRARLSGGAGLGLAIVKHLVEMHNGKILVKSPIFEDENGNVFGTVFNLQFPLSK